MALLIVDTETKKWYKLKGYGTLKDGDVTLGMFPDTAIGDEGYDLACLIPYKDLIIQSGRGVKYFAFKEVQRKKKKELPPL